MIRKIYLACAFALGCQSSPPVDGSEENGNSPRDVSSEGGVEEGRNAVDREGTNEGIAPCCCSPDSRPCTVFYERLLADPARYAGCSVIVGGYVVRVDNRLRLFSGPVTYPVPDFLGIPLSISSARRVDPLPDKVAVPVLVGGTYNYIVEGCLYEGTGVLDVRTLTRVDSESP